MGDVLFYKGGIWRNFPSYRDLSDGDYIAFNGETYIVRRTRSDTPAIVESLSSGSRFSILVTSHLVPISPYGDEFVSRRTRYELKDRSDDDTGTGSEIVFWKDVTPSNRSVGTSRSLGSPRNLEPPESFGTLYLENRSTRFRSSARSVEAPRPSGPPPSFGVSSSVETYRSFGTLRSPETPRSPEPSRSLGTSSSRETSRSSRDPRSPERPGSRLLPPATVVRDWFHPRRD
jgi:hypothetical protein